MALEQAEKRFTQLIDRWFMAWPDLQGSTDLETRNNINGWLDDFEIAFRTGSRDASISGGLDGFRVSRDSSGDDSSSKTFKALYSNDISALIQKDFTKARGLRNALAVQFGASWRQMYKEFEVFAKERTALGFTHSQTVSSFMSQPIFRDSAFIPVPTNLESGLVMHNWDPRAYANMYARTTGRQNEDEIMFRDMVETNQDIVQISNIATDTPICLKHVGKFYSLTGSTPGFPVIEVRPPFHPNCVHSMIPSPKIDSLSAQSTNKAIDKRFKSKDFTEGQMKSLAKQETWNTTNRRNPFLGVAA